MSACDGNATQRIIDTAMGEDYKRFRKTTPLPKDDYHLIPSADDFEELLKKI